MIGWIRCTICGHRADRARGVYLERLYPREFFCCGCGRRSIFCECRAA